ncbi:unnamed protein product [Symbiodinium microadriaticum]|nr:unnamed protein product [Symbiodinium microadriaticum]
MGGCLCIAVNQHGELCGLHKPGGLPLDFSMIQHCMELAVTKAKEITNRINSELEADLAKRKQAQRNVHQLFNEVNLLTVDWSTTSSKEATVPSAPAPLPPRLVLPEVRPEQPPSEEPPPEAPPPAPEASKAAEEPPAPAEEAPPVEQVVPKPRTSRKRAKPAAASEAAAAPPPPAVQAAAMDLMEDDDGRDLEAEIQAVAEEAAELEAQLQAVAESEITALAEASGVDWDEAMGSTAAAEATQEDTPLPAPKKKRKKKIARPA